MPSIVERILLSLMSILFPPAAVYTLCGVGLDLALNCVLFVLAVLPSHVHALYISWIYFKRRRKVKKGNYPGDEKMMIFSEKVTNGGASNEEAERLRRIELGLPPIRSRSRSRHSRRHSRERSKSREVEERDYHHSSTRASSRSRPLRLEYDPRYSQHIARDGYGPAPHMLPQRSPSRTRRPLALEYKPGGEAGSQVPAKHERRRDVV